MATAIEPKSAEMVYANSGITDTMEAQNKFEDRFQFRRSSDLPPPLPPHTNTSKDQITLPRVGTKPKDSLSSPRSPRVGVKYHWESKDTSFDTIESSKEDTSYRETHYKEQFLLHDTLKTIAVRESTQRASNMVINRYICLTIVLTNLMSIGFSVLGSILVMKSVSPCNPNFHLDPQARFTDTIKQGPDYLTNPSYHSGIYHPVDTKPVELQPVDYPVLTLKSDAETDTEADTHTDVTADDADTYQIQIKVSAPENQTIDHGHKDFWLN